MTLPRFGLRQFRNQFLQFSDALFELLSRTPVVGETALIGEGRAQVCGVRGTRKETNGDGERNCYAMFHV